MLEALVGIYARLRLRVNAEKSAVARVWDRQFLGFSFWVAPGRVVKRRVAPKALNAMKSASGQSRHVTALAAYFAGNWWRVPGHPALHLALPGSYFAQLGVPHLVVR